MTERRQPLPLDPMTVEPRLGSTYPGDLRKINEGREKRALGDAVGLDGFGVNLVTMPPGCWSAQRHWHSHEDEFVYIVSGRLTLVTEAGEQELTAGMVAGFPAGVEDGHCLINNSDEVATYLEVGGRLPDQDSVVYPDVDLAVGPGRVFTDKAGKPV